MKTFVLGGGCFWCLDAVYQMTKGVHSVVSGYTGGAVENPSYDQVCSGMTGHAEVVSVMFDENVVPAEIILDMFFAQHDPTTLNRQGYDTGTQYRSSMFYTTAEDQAMFQAALERSQPNFRDPIVTEIVPLGHLYVADGQHQDFYARRPEVGYCQVIINPKIAKVRKHYAEWLTA
ncbi:peptide-methionine (S)-S-oxide reductase MsrA [Arthrobacter cryoconiti]|uniref:Peptide methionine sulfoxide reductase MsrA n=1 Tax=Arthrobacter cryoconiti TaxID=748907 RepID=A0ABV8QY83_9MICC|nr:peptide-methionine (S)-S-oxide reductase MsrA [Arthrobacter cryoconiti]MCC9068863.1 peptide-methionine (S)-S-oxide reductase MsrA [Arthrobacter cryoconiti]